MFRTAVFLIHHLKEKKQGKWFELRDECKIQQFLLFEGGKNNSRQTHLVLSLSDCILVWVAVLAFIKWSNNFQQPRGSPTVREEYDESLDYPQKHTD